MSAASALSNQAAAVRLKIFCTHQSYRFADRTAAAESTRDVRSRARPQRKEACDERRDRPSCVDTPAGSSPTQTSAKGNGKACRNPGFPGDLFGDGEWGKCAELVGGCLRGRQRDVFRFAAYAIDKSSAVAGEWRISEGTLILLGLACGWPGAIVAQQFLRHKSSKASFQLAFWGSVFVNIVAFVSSNMPLAQRLQG
jgi:uncharacterized membrane protein YsdA (DUF1294 family)